MQIIQEFLENDGGYVGPDGDYHGTLGTLLKTMSGIFRESPMYSHKISLSKPSSGSRPSGHNRERAHQAED